MERTKREQDDKRTRVEFVKGRSIVTFTARVKKNSSLSEDQWAAQNGRMIALAAKAGNKIERDFRLAKDDLAGEALVAEAESQARAVQKSQERVGHAIVHVAMIEYKHREIAEAAQDMWGRC